MKTIPLWPLALASGLMLGACSQAATPEAASVAAPAVPASPPLPVAPVTPPPAASHVIPAPLLAQVTVHKSPTCGCCTAWVDHMTQAGYPVEVIEEEDLSPLKLALGVPSGTESCHTAIVGDYFIEGHVPAEDVARLLRERPDARGLTVPGMPVGSPGMEVPSGEVQPYVVFLVNKDGSTTLYSEHGR